MVFVRGTDDSGILENTEKIAKPYGMYLWSKFFKNADKYHRGLSTLSKYHRKAVGLQFFFHHSDIIFF